MFEQELCGGRPSVHQLVVGAVLGQHDLTLGREGPLRELTRQRLRLVDIAQSYRSQCRHVRRAAILPAAGTTMLPRKEAADILVGALQGRCRACPCRRGRIRGLRPRRPSSLTRSSKVNISALMRSAELAVVFLQRSDDEAGFGFWRSKLLKIFRHHLVGRRDGGSATGFRHEFGAKASVRRARSLPSAPPPFSACGRPHRAPCSSGRDREHSGGVLRLSASTATTAMVCGYSFLR